MKRAEHHGRLSLERAKKVARRSLRWWPVYLVAVAGAVVAAVYAPVLIKAEYVSSAVLVYQELIPPAMLVDSGAIHETPRQRGARLRETLLSRTNLEQIIDELGLYPDVIARRGKTEAVNELLDDVDVKVGENTFAITCRYHDAVQAQQLAGRLADTLIAQSSSHRAKQAASTMQFLDAQRRNAEEELTAKEQKLAEFLAAHPEFAQDAVVPDGASPVGASIRARERKQAAALREVEAGQRQRAALLSRMSSIERRKPRATPPADEPTADPEALATLAQAEREAASAASALQQARARYTEKHPDVTRAAARLAEANQAVAAARALAAPPRAQPQAPQPAAPEPAPSHAERKALGARLEATNRSIAEARSRGVAGRPADAARPMSNWVVDLETQWASINRELRDVLDRYREIERRYFQASIIDSIEVSGGAAQMIVVDPAYLPERPSRNGPRRVAAVAAALVLVLLGAVALLLAQRDDRLHDLIDLDSLGLDGFRHAIPQQRGDRHG